mmetsp:Transcript_6149/g.10057  ORF Transcript_6149/g.10057 Transcript_6149/m.10057 type:complete len:551 (+) Transcript_6149:105-1757(+)
MLRRVRRASTGARPCKVLFTIEIKSLVFPYEILESLGQEAEISFTFKRGDKAVTTYECDMSMMANGCVEVTCSEKMALEVTMYQESDCQYQKKQGKLLVQVLTPNGWEDLGKTHIDLHVIANDLQPIPINVELEKCIVKGSVLSFVISPQLLDAHVDDGTVDTSMSEISELTMGGTPIKVNKSNNKNNTGRMGMSLTRMFSKKMGLSSDNNPATVIEHTAHSTPTTQEVMSTHSKADLAVSLSSPGDNTTSDGAINDGNVSVTSDYNANSVASSHSEFRGRISPTNNDRKDRIGAAGSFETPTSGTPSVERKEDESPRALPLDPAMLQQELDLLKETHDLAFSANADLKNDNEMLTAKLNKLYVKYKDSQKAAQELGQQLTRKDTEIKAVLNFQKKLESRMSAFVEKERQLISRESALQLQKQELESFNAEDSVNEQKDEELVKLKAEIVKLEKHIESLKEERREQARVSANECDQLRLDIKKMRDGVPGIASDGSVINVMNRNKKTFGDVSRDFLEVAFVFFEIETAMKEWYKYVTLMAVIAAYFILWK